MNEIQKTMHRISEDYLRFQCPSTGLVKIATTENLQDPRRDIAREIIMDMFQQVFEPGSNYETTCEIHGTIPYAHGYCPHCIK
jgi:hypothetical protein